jgi:hypothetical protein
MLGLGEDVGWLVIGERHWRTLTSACSVPYNIERDQNISIRICFGLGFYGDGAP